MALDYLPIQASSVPSERVFSSSAETDTKRRNRIKPELMEALQMLKFSLKGQRLDFGAGAVSSEGSLAIEMGGAKQGDIYDEAMKVSSDGGTWDTVLELLKDAPGEESDN